MTPRRIDHELDRATWRLQRATTVVPEVLAHLQEQLLFATYGANDAETRVGGGDTSDPTVAAMFRRDPVVQLRATVLEKRNAVGRAIDELDEACRRALGMRVAMATEWPKCNGGDPSSWGHAECGENVESYPLADGGTRYRSEMLCARHRKRKQRWESGLPPEEAA